MNKQTGPLANRLHRLVRGQVRSYFNDHPVLEGRARGTAVSGISKRVVGDLLVFLGCQQEPPAVVVFTAAAASNRPVVLGGPEPAGVGAATAPAGMLTHHLDEFFAEPSSGVLSHG